jgi:hypothetical protein
MTAAEEAIAFVEAHRRVRILPVSKSLRNTLIRHYIYARRIGQGHRDASNYATLSLDPVTIMLIGWAIKIILYLAKLWWEKNDVSIA